MCIKSSPTRDLLDEALAALERLAGKRRRGRPPDWLREVRAKAHAGNRAWPRRADRD